MAGKKGQKKRFWPDDEKRSICMQAMVPCVSVAQVARRYSMNANLIHNWLKDPRFTPEREEGEPCSDTAFLPVEIDATIALASIPGDAVSAQRVDITLSDGRRISGKRLPGARQQLCRKINPLCGPWAEKNYLFLCSDGGGKAAAIAYTLIETAKLNGADQTGIPRFKP